MKKLLLCTMILLITPKAWAQWTEAGDDIDRFVVVGDSIVAVTDGNKLVVSTDAGATWNENITLPWDEDPAYDVRTPFYANGKFYVYAGNSQSGFFRNTTSLEEWEPIEEGLPHYDSSTRRLHDIFSSFELNGKLYAYTGVNSTLEDPHTVVMSNDWGDSWTIQSEGLEDYTTFTTNGEALLFVNKGGVFQSADQGVTIEQVGDHDFDSTLKDFVASGDTLVALLEVADFQFGLDVSFDFGQTWKRIDIHALYEHFMDVAFMYKGKFYGQAFSGEGFTVDLATEEVISLGTPTFLFAGIQERTMYPYNFQARGDLLYAVGRNGNNTKLFSRSLSGTSTETEPTMKMGNFRLDQNYPNPFNPATSIAYSLEQAGKVQLRIFNNLGQEIAILVNGIETAGNHTVSFDAAGLPSGVYIYRIEVGEDIQTRKMTLIK